MSEAKPTDPGAPLAQHSPRAAKIAPGASKAQGDWRRQLREQVEWRPVVGIAFLAGIAIVANQRLNVLIDNGLDPAPPKARAGEWAVGKEADLQITLITDDWRKLACASEAVVDGTHCGNDAQKRRWPKEANAPLDDNNVNIIQPYRTADTNQLVYVAGLWAEPELAMRLHLEPPEQYPADKLLRFIAYCRVRFVGDLNKANVRWEQGGQWQEEATGLVAKPVRCTLSQAAKDPSAGAG